MSIRFKGYSSKRNQYPVYKLSETKANKNKSKKQFFFFLTWINCTCDKIILHHCFCTYICVTKDEMKDETKQTRVIP